MAGLPNVDVISHPRLARDYFLTIKEWYHSSAHNALRELYALTFRDLSLAFLPRPVCVSFTAGNMAFYVYCRVLAGISSKMS